MYIPVEELPSYEEFGQEVLAGVDELDSLDVIEIVMSHEENNLESMSDEEDEELERITALPDRERRMTVLQLGLRGGMEFETSMFGIPVMVQPVSQSTEPPRRPDGSGDREPRNPSDPTNPGTMALALPA